MKIFKGQTEDRFLGNLLLTSNGLFLVISGWYFIVSDQTPQTITYDLMTNLMPLEAWGVLMGVAGLLLCAAVFQLGKMRYSSMFAGGFLGSGIVALYAMASAQGAVTFLVPSRYAVLAGINLLIACIGGLQIWRMKKATSPEES